MTLATATCQFPVSADIGRNTRYVLRQMTEARGAGARVAHFPEGALSGYAGPDFSSFTGFDWDKQQASLVRVASHAEALGIWVVVGGAHRLTGRRKPHNSVYVIDDRGRLRERYDKRFCSGDPGARSGDLAHYSPGDHAAVFRIDGVRCAVLVCYDVRFPELYRELAGEEVELVFHSFHAGGVTKRGMREARAYAGSELERLSGAATIPGVVMPATVTASAANNYLWISASNNSARESCWASFVARPDGFTVGRLRRNVAGVLVTDVDVAVPLYDSTAAWRRRAMEGTLHSGRLPGGSAGDSRSRDRSRF